MSSEGHWLCWDIYYFVPKPGNMAKMEEMEEIQARGYCFKNSEVKKPATCMESYVIMLKYRMRYYIF
jgi:hypothetical protein